MENAYLKIAEDSKKYKVVQNLMAKINKENLINQHKLQISKKASGIDRVNKIEYGKNLEQNIEKLLRKMKNFSYRPLPVKRVNIPKSGSQKLRPLGIPVYEDRLVQGVMANILNAIYEPKFKNFSYGFRPKRSCHDAIKALDTVIMTQKTRFAVDADIKGFFDNVNQEWLIKFLEHDIKGKNFIRYIKKFLKAGIMEQGKHIESDKGTPQGGLISPILANVYLHYVLDIWFEKEVTKKFNGESYMVSYADDFVCCFRYEEEANKFYKMLEERLRKFGLELSKDKTKIVHFGRFARRNERETKFDFFDASFHHLPLKNGHPNADVIPERPKKFEEMKEIASILSKGFPEVRVDLYECNGDVFFGELTFFHWSGLMPYDPEEWDYRFGEWLKLPQMIDHD